MCNQPGANDLPCRTVVCGRVPIGLASKRAHGAGVNVAGVSVATGYLAEFAPNGFDLCRPPGVTRRPQHVRIDGEPARR